MGISLRLLVVVCGALLVTGCSVPMVALSDVNFPHLIDKGLTKEQIKESILGGARYAGWEAQYQGNDTILASYQIRRHSVDVNIFYSELSYRVEYKKSFGMKMACTKGERYRVSGTKNCPNYDPPEYIHANYYDWIDYLALAIRVRLSRAD